MINIGPTLYELIGGEIGLRKLVERFYDLIDSAPEAAQIRALHPKSLKQSREKFFMFLSGWSGGPSLYMEKYGHPRLRMRHVIKYFRSVFPDLKYEIIETAALADRVWIRYKAQGTQQGSAWGFPPTGKAVEFSGATILYIQDGKVIDRWGGIFILRYSGRS